MNQLTTQGIILARTDYGEADRIITMLTPDSGKLRLIAKGVRRMKSRLAGGIELFSTSDLTYIKGRGEMGTLVSTRLIHFYSSITKNIDRTMLGYELIKQLHKTTEDEPESEYYHMLEQAFAALDEATLDLDLIRVWFNAQLLQQAGHMPNLQTDVTGAKLQADHSYEFSFDDSTFIDRPDGSFTANDIKFLRLVFNGNAPAVLSKVANASLLAAKAKPLVTLLQQQYIH